MSPYFVAMSGSSDNGIVKQLRTVIEEDREIIRKLRQEVDRLRYLLGVQSLSAPKSDTVAGLAPQSRTQKLHPGFSN